MTMMAATVLTAEEDTASRRGYSHITAMAYYAAHQAVHENLSASLKNEQ